MIWNKKIEGVGCPEAIGRPEGGKSQSRRVPLTGDQILTDCSNLYFKVSRRGTVQLQPDQMNIIILPALPEALQLR